MNPRGNRNGSQSYTSQTELVEACDSALADESPSDVEYSENNIDETESDESYSTIPDYNISSSTSSSSDYYQRASNFTDFEPSDNDVPGVVVYEGENDYFIIETRRGYLVAETISRYLSEDDKVYGNLNSYGSKWILKQRGEDEVKVYIEDYGLSSEDALNWLGEHDKLKSRDQQIYDYRHQ